MLYKVFPGPAEEEEALDQIIKDGFREIKSPNTYPFICEKEEYPLRFNPQALFLAGGISGCPDWQSEMVKLLEDTDLIIYNPRRDDFDTSNLSLSEQQIEWEYKHLNRSHWISFWFPCETLCPITLYELGVWANCTNTNTYDVFVGCHPDYARKFDVVKQLSLMNPRIEVVFSLEELANQIKEQKKTLSRRLRACYS